MQNKRILIMAGGTGGHVFPALAVAEMMRQQGWTVEWLGTRQGMEADIVRRAGFPLHFISITGVRREGIIKRLLAPLRLCLALIQALFILYRFKPNVVLGMGGFAAGPGGLAAWILRKPLVIHEQNAIAGVTNHLLSRFATRVLEGFPDSFRKRTNAIYTGNPVRSTLLQIPSPEHRFEGKDKLPLKVLILGGSQGAQALNALCPEAFGYIALAERPMVRHQTGSRKKEITELAYKEADVQATIQPFIQDMAEAYAWADVVICRAGALTVAELAAVGVGSILIPFPYAVDDHQTYNGRFLERGGAAQMISQTVLNPQGLADIIVGLTRNRAKVFAMAKAAQRLSRPDAAEKVVTHCIEVSCE